MPVKITEPIERETLWRYMSLEKLLWLLQRNCLYFSQLKQFPDPYEGAASLALQWAPCKVGDDPVFQPIKEEHILDYRYVNCWHSNPDESAAMWSVYSRTSGVAVTTTLERLEVALRDASQNIGIAAVHYRAITPGLAAGSPWTIKRPSFAHEREVRAGFRDPECGKPGVGIPVDVAALMEKIYVSPEPKVRRSATPSCSSSAKVRRTFCLLTFSVFFSSSVSSLPASA